MNKYIFSFKEKEEAEIKNNNYEDPTVSIIDQISLQLNCKWLNDMRRYKGYWS